MKEPNDQHDPKDPVGDEDLRRQEAALRPVLGAPSGDSSGDDLAGNESGGESAFRARLRDAFVSGSFEGDEAPEPRLAEALESWDAPAPTAEFRDSVRSAFLGGAAGQGAADQNVSSASDVDGSEPQDAPTHTLRPVTRRDRPSTGRRAPAPARTSSMRLRLLGAGSLVAAAAAVLMMVTGTGPFATSDPSGDPNGLPNGLPGGLPGGGTSVADAGGSDSTSDSTSGSTSGPGSQTDSVNGSEINGPIVTAPQVAWSVDEIAESERDDVLRGLRIDDRSFGTWGDFESALASAETLRVGERPIRLLRGDQFVLGLDPGTVIELDADDLTPNADVDQLVLFASAGSVHVATGPGFDSDHPLVLRTPHVRTEVVGTIFGVDIGADYTCVCCLEGEVHTESGCGDHVPRDVLAGSGRVLLADGREQVMSTAPAGHLGPLRELESFWL